MYHDFLILGGAGLVGLQVCRHIVTQLDPRRIVVASLKESEAVEACQKLEAEFGDRIAFVPEWGNLFVPTDLADTPRGEIMASAKQRRRLLAALYDDFEAAYGENHLVRIIRRHRPEVIVDCVNTATGLSYQDVFDGAAKVRSWISDDGYDAKGISDMEALLLSQTGPQIIRHVRLVHRATTEYTTRVYLKCGTTGTGGMGLNIPYTHSEDKPSRKLLAKNEAAFGHTGLMFLLARTPNAPIVKEVKPAAMIGYRGVRVIQARDRYNSSDLYEPREIALEGDSLQLRESLGDYKKSGSLDVPVVDTGENGVFTRGEFAAITALGQMEYITPEEIAKIIVLEIRGANTGQDIISAMDASVLSPSYKAGLLRSAALSDLAQAEEESKIPSIALGRLGPPELSKLLFEAQLLKHACGSLTKAVATSPEALSAAVVKALGDSGVSRTAPSIGIPVLMPDGKRMLRGPRINVPEVIGHTTTVPLTDADTREAWISKGWIDLRVRNMAVWKGRLEKMIKARAVLRDAGSAAASIESYLGNHFEIGEVVAWIFNNEMGGYRVK
ncbi:MAG: hypothetical protein P8R54_28510 [Myxococcota bacterium]|nr:hypothetical protein [Myxococcota bacterium]